MLAHSKGAQLVYFTKLLPKWLLENPCGNYAHALRLGTKVVPLTSKEYAEVFGTAEHGVLPALAPPPSSLLPDDALWLPQGGAAADAEVGISMLAKEITSWHWQR